MHDIIQPSLLLGELRNKSNSIQKCLLFIFLAEYCIGKFNLMNSGEVMSLILLDWDD